MKRVLFRPQAARDLEGLPSRNRDQVEEAIERFALTNRLWRHKDAGRRGAPTQVARRRLASSFRV
jgi:mRNA-degrading endonuclease RelE of RelBE toxin-antitoxin system